MSRLLCSLLLILAFATEATPLDVPHLEARVTDLAGLLTTEQSAALETKLRDLETRDSTQVAVLIIPSLEGEPLEDYSIRVATAWRLGQKGRDNGALLLVAMKERILRIEVGYGLEATLTDARSRQIIQNEILPHFRQGDYYEGIEAGVSAIIGVVRGVYQPTARDARRPSRSAARKPFDWLIMLLIPGLWLLSSTGVWGGGLLGAGAGAYLGYLVAGASLLPLLVGGSLGGVLGGIVGAVVRSAGRRTTRRGWRGGPFFYGGG